MFSFRHMFLVVFSLTVMTVSVTSNPTATPEARQDSPESNGTASVEGTDGSQSEELERLKDELRKDVMKELEFRFAKTGNMQSGFFVPPYQFHYYQPVRTLFHRSEDMSALEELSIVKQLLQTTDNRLQATEYRLQAIEYDLQTTKSKLQAVENRLGTELDEPQATQSRPRSCEDKLIATQERLESAERKLALVDDTISSTDALSITVRNQGSTFVRWGRSQCPNNTQLVYSGIAGGSWFEHKGAAANRLCLTLEPELDDAALPPYVNELHGMEYQNILGGHQDHDAPCSVCRTPQSTTIMVPATLTCPTGWVTQYSGHLVAGYHGHEAASEFLCLDGEPEHRPSGEFNRNGAMFYNTVTHCGSLPCPPYTGGKVATCVVCSQ